LSFGLVSTGSTGGYSHSTPIGVGTGKLFHDHSLVCKVDLQGRPSAPNVRWETALNLSGAISQEVMTDNSGYCEFDVLADGEHTLCVKNAHTLQNKVNVNLPLANDNSVIDFGLLLEGDVNDNNLIDTDDFSALFYSKDKCQADTDFNANADLNVDGCVSVDDAKLLQSNYLQVGQVCNSVRSSQLRSPRNGNQSDTMAALYTSPIPMNVEAGSTIEFDIKVSTETGVDAVAAYLNFPPAKIRVNSLKAGERFDFILQNAFDNTQGYINYAAGVWENDVPTGMITLVTVNATLLETGAEQYFSFNSEFPRLTTATFAGQTIAKVQMETQELASATCQVYAVNDKGLNHSQFFTISLDDHTVSKLGPLYKGHDIEALAIHPATNMIYAASGNDVADGNPKGHLYLVEGETGELFPVGRTGFEEIGDLAFSPDGTLWAWAKGDGLITINPTTGAGTLAIASDVLVEGLTLSKETNRTVFYGSVNTELWVYDMDAETLEIACTNLLGETEALEMMPDGILLMGIDRDKSFSLHAFDAKACQVVVEADMPTNQFNDVEGIALPIEACAK
jgi:hypothetical protein